MLARNLSLRTRFLAPGFWSSSMRFSTTSDASKPAPILFETRDSVHWIRLNRPKRYNAMTTDMFESIITALKRAESDSGIKFVAITGTGEYFSSGNDLSKLKVQRVLFGFLVSNYFFIDNF